VPKANNENLVGTALEPPSVNEAVAPATLASAPPPLAQEAGTGGTKLVSVLYSTGRDLYCLPAMLPEKLCWLSVKVYTPPATTVRRDEIYLGPSVTADGLGWRKAYASAWRAILSGDRVTIPADDPIVKDYEAFKI
jgi:hypothetical protein